MKTTLAVNPRRRRRRAAPRPRRRRSSPIGFAPRRRRRNPTLRIANPGGGGVVGMLTPAVMVALGAIAATVLPRTLKVLKSDASKTTAALAAIATGFALNMVGGKFLGRKNAEMLALGAMSAGLSTFLNQVLPAGMRLSGVGDVVTEADIDAEIRKLAAGGMMGVGDTTQEAFSSFAGDGDDPYSVAIAGADDYAMSTMA